MGRWVTAPRSDTAAAAVTGTRRLVVLVVVIAVVVAVGLVSSEGVRFDGFAAMSSAQPVHLRAADGRQSTIPMADLSPDWVAETVEAKVMDDEGYRHPASRRRAAGPPGRRVQAGHRNHRLQRGRDRVGGARR